MDVGSKRVELDEKILQRLYWEEGLTLAEVGARLGVSGTCVMRKMRGYGIPRRPAHRPRGRGVLVGIAVSGVVQLYREQELSLRLIGEAYGCSAETVRRCLADAGVPRRHSGWQQSRIRGPRCARCGILVEEPGLCGACMEETRSERVAG